MAKVQKNSFPSRGSIFGSNHFFFTKDRLLQLLGANKPKRISKMKILQTPQLKSTVQSSTHSSSPTAMESQQKRQRKTRLAGRNLRRKLSRETDAASSIVMQITEVEEDEEADLVASIRRHVEVLNSSFSDREAVKEAAAAISSLAKIDENVEMMVENGVIPALVRYLESPWSLAINPNVPKSCDHKLEKDCAVSLGLIAAIQPGYQQLIVDAGAIVPTVKLLKRRGVCLGCMEANAVIRRAADIITNIAHDNPRIKTNIRVEGGIPPLVELLNFPDVKVQRAAAGALRTVSFRNDDNKNQIVELNALPTLVLMLQSEDPSMHGEAIGAIGNLVHSSPDIKKDVIRAGALQPVISLLSSTCLETQREAALLIGQFASPDSDCKVHIAQRGAITPLIKMLESSDEQVMEMSAFALGRLAQDTHNQAGIGQRGGIISLLNLLDVNTGSVQHNAAFALYGLADNEENLADFIKAGGIQRLQDDNFTVQPTRDCVVRTLKRLENKVHGPVLNQLLYLMRTTEKPIQMRIALALAHLCDPKDGKLIFIDNNGVEFLLELLYLSGMKQQKYSSRALFELARKATSFAPEDSAPSSPTQRVFLGAEFVNNPTLSDVTFLVDGKQFYAHKICLVASSDIFRAMFDGLYKERNAQNVEIPNITWEVFELMMRFIYTGRIDITKHLAQELLVAADQYLIEGLKRLCEYTIAQDICVDNIPLMYDLADTFNASALRRACTLYVLEHYTKLSSETWFPMFIKKIIPEIRTYITDILTRPVQASSTVV
ncbi:ARMADILLO BTB ARABIDOPSIS PROTEIN 1 [Brassica rapa]|uniref:ARMADILLO BTB ARABIDOPSIS PROTEIN 1 n=1 Tax=Brassica campestris TaxID=3711 RepID=UPI00142D38C5|nr:ARMADILLO BTB ARABIDOPSIS PROTEIN 1 [Brassica rapa]